MQPQEVTWGHIAADAEANPDDALNLWARVCEVANDELESGKRGAKVAGHNANPYALAQYLAIRDSFADQWKPQGGIESAMVEMLAISYSLEMYWSGIAHDRAIRVCDAQSEASKRYASSGWKLPYQSEADAVDQAHRLADGYNKQFMRVLRQLRDLRRYSPVVIQNAQQVNVGNHEFWQKYERLMFEVDRIIGLTKSLSKNYDLVKVVSEIQDKRNDLSKIGLLMRGHSILSMIRLQTNSKSGLTWYGIGQYGY